MTATLHKFPVSAQASDEVEHRETVVALERLINAKATLIQNLRGLLVKVNSGSMKSIHQVGLKKLIEDSEKTLSRLKKSKDIFIANK